MLRLLPVALAALLALPATAQGRALGLLGGGTTVSIGVGGRSLDTDALAAALAADGYGTLEASGVWTTVATEVGLGRLAVGLDRSALRRAEVDGGARLATFDAEATVFRLGARVRAGRARLTPTLDLGVGRTEVGLRDGPPPLDVEDVFADPAQGESLVARTPLVGASLGVSLPLGGRRGGRRAARRVGPSLVLGARAGYLAALGDADWHTDDGIALAGGPEAALAGPYARLSLGLSFGRR
ncbi:MAG: hypothetical protein AAGJ11_19575 [Bacteroidota bacterium]